MDNFAEMNGVYEQYFSHKPSRSCVAVKELPKGMHGFDGKRIARTTLDCNVDALTHIALAETKLF